MIFLFTGTKNLTSRTGKAVATQHDYPYHKEKQP